MTSSNISKASSRSSFRLEPEEEKEEKGICQLSVPLWTLIALGAVAIVLCIAIGVGVSMSGKQQPQRAGTTKAPVTVQTVSPVAPTVAPWRLRLPRSLIPLEYHLWLQPYLPSASASYPASKNFTFDGKVSIIFNCSVTSNNITLNGDRILLQPKSLSLAHISGSKSGAPTITGHSYSNATQMFVFSLGSQLQPGNTYNLSMVYSGFLANDLKGFYRSQYSEYGQTKWMAVTQFQPTDARRALPCFDEPNMKAQFFVTIKHPQDMVALSNAQQTATNKNGNGWVTTTFGASPQMSTYLLAFAVCDFKSIKVVSNTSHHTVFRVWARPSLINQTSWASIAGPRVLEFYEKYYKVDFPLQKQDLIALPELSFGAMENWGLVTYKERELLYDPSIYPAQVRKAVADVVAHELAHQWFGDLVTMDWWSDLWLNEGFATVMEYRGTDEIADYSYQMYNEIVLTTGTRAMELDQLPSSHPVFVPVATPDEINEIFDSISYDKGGAVLRMLNQTMGGNGQNFRDGLTTYLKAHKYGNAKHQDLWNALNQICQQRKVMGWNNQILNVTEFMNRWILQKGFPVLSLSWTPSASSISISQSRFLLGNDTSNKYPSPYGYTWYTPVWYRNSTGGTSMFWATPGRNAIHNAPAFSSSQSFPMVLNPQGFGFYRVNYDSVTWNKLESSLNRSPGSFDVRFRIKIIDDAMNLARANMLNYSSALSLFQFIKKEQNYFVWHSAITTISPIGRLLAKTSNYELYQNFMLKLLMPTYNRMTWNDSVIPDTNVLNHELRALVLGEACSLGLNDCLNRARKLFNQYQNACNEKQSSGTCNPISPNLRPLVYCNAVAGGGASEWDFLWARYQTEPVSIERIALLKGLTCPTQPWLITKLLDAVVVGQVRHSEARLVYKYLPSNQVAMAVSWNYVIQKWTALKKIFGSNLFTLGALVKATTSSFATQAELQQIESFVASHSDLGTARNSFEQSISAIQNNIAWMKSYSGTVISWLKANNH